MKTLISFILILFFGLGLFIQEIEFFFLELNVFPWLITKLLFKGIEVILLIFLVVFSIKNFGWVRGAIISFICIAFVAVCIALKSPIFLDDFKTNKSTKKDLLFSDTNTVLLNLNKAEPNFNGLLCIVDADCNHCHLAGKTLTSFKKRNPEIDVSFLVFSKKISDLKLYRKKAGTHNFKHYLAENMLDVLHLTLGSFPCFFYVRDNTITERWFGEEFSLSTIDQIEQEFRKIQ